MKLRWSFALLMGLSLVTMTSGCGEKKAPELEVEQVSEQSKEKEAEAEASKEDALKEDISKEDVAKEESAEDALTQEENTEANEIIEKQEEEGFSFEAFKTINFSFSSGAGAWGTGLEINQDGSFSGSYHDMDMGVTGDLHPNGTRYECRFTGSFSKPEKVNEYTYQMHIESMEYEREVGTDEILDGVFVSYTDAFGLEGTEDFYIYLPGTPLNELPEDLRWWLVNLPEENVESAVLEYYVIHNKDQNFGFVGSDIIESHYSMLEWSEEYVLAMEDEIKNTPFTEEELVQKAVQIYETWDMLLNDQWSILKRIYSPEEFQKLTEEQRGWIADKEAMIQRAQADIESGIMEPQVVHLQAAEMTKQRVYEFLQYIKEYKQN